MYDTTVSACAARGTCVHSILNDGLKTSSSMGGWAYSRNGNDSCFLLKIGIRRLPDIRYWPRVGFGYGTVSNLEPATA